MSSISESEWKKALTFIIEDLDKPQLKKMLGFLDIPKQKKTTKSRETIPQTIIEFYGVEKSIQKIDEAMLWIPRKDEAVQDQLRPFVEKLKNKENEGNKGNKRKRSETESESAEKTPEAGRQTHPETVARGRHLLRPVWLRGEIEKRHARKSIHDVKISGDLGNKVIAGKVVQKSGLRTYETKKREKKFFFYLGVADETGSIKVMVYGRERYQRFQEKSCYLFREVIMEENVIKGESIMKVTKKSIISKTAPIDVPENLEMEARMLIYSQTPVCSIGQAIGSEEKTSVSVEGKVTEIGSVETVKLKNKRRKRDKREFQLEDGTGSIWITLWGEDMKQLRGISPGDSVRVVNVKTSHYYDSVSLNSTDFTRIFKVQSATVENVTIQIIGIKDAKKTETEVDAQISSGEVQSFVVTSSLLAKAFGVRLEGDFEDRLLEKMPFSADVEIKGNKIMKIKYA
ncbi:forkhead box protein G [Sarotherodon galilaeus]